MAIKIGNKPIEFNTTAPLLFLLSLFFFWNSLNNSKPVSWFAYGNRMSTVIRDKCVHRVQCSRESPAIQQSKPPVTCGSMEEWGGGGVAATRGRGVDRPLLTYQRQLLLLISPIPLFIHSWRSFVTGNLMEFIWISHFAAAMVAK